MYTFYYDEKQNGFVAELNSVRFFCEEVKEEYSELLQTLDDIHIIDVEFGGIFEEFYEVMIDG